MAVQKDAPGALSGPVVGIDVLRLIAALMVVSFHFGFKAIAEVDGVIAATRPGGHWLPAGWPWTWWGWVGVQVFFVISGLVIAYSARSARGQAGRFVRSRFLRLLPVVLISASFAAIVECLVFGLAPGEAAFRWFRTVSFWPFPPWIMGQFWTLGIEICFYALVALLILTGREAYLGKVAAGLILLSLAYWSLRVLGGGHDPLGRVTALALLQHGAYFGIGILFAEGRSPERRRRWHLPCVLAGIIAAALQIRMAAQWEGGGAGVAGSWPVAFAVFLLCCGFVLLSLSWNSRILARIGADNTQVLHQMGIMTYPLYLIHNHVGKPVMIAVLAARDSVSLAVLCGMGTALVVAWLIAVYMEPPVYRCLARIYDAISGFGTKSRNPDTVQEK